MRSTISLNGKWDFNTDASDKSDLIPQGDWPKQIEVPAAWELTEGHLYDGPAWYSRTFEAPQTDVGHRVWLKFDAVATHATVYLNGDKLGTHSGDWTPFEFDVTSHLQKTNNLAVHVVEERDRMTRGFTSCAMPHAGGIWQDVGLEIRPERRAKKPLWIGCDWEAKTVEVRVEFEGCDGLRADISLLDRHQRDVIEQTMVIVENGRASAVLPADKLYPWRIGWGYLHNVRVRVWDGGFPIDQVVERFGFRDVKADGQRLLLNGEPIFARGWLSWGVYPEHIAPRPTKQQIRKEFKDLVHLGFNMHKLCLWMPPQYLVDIADEMGVLLWQEYPTWVASPMFGPDNYPEWDEMFIRDRSHPSIIVRSLTCESQGATQDVMHHLYDRAHQIIPRSIICDNSGFFVNWSKKQKEMKTDMYSDHPYFDCQHYETYLNQVTERLAELPKRPLITGESMDCDTYRDVEEYRRHFPDGLPWWLDWKDKPFCPMCKVDMVEFGKNQDKWEAEVGQPLPDNLKDLSFKHAAVHLKFQVESFRKRDEFTGYTLIGIRDSIGNTPGFYDDFGKLKHTRKELLPFNNSTILMLDTGRIHQNFLSGEKADLRILASCFDSNLAGDCRVHWSLKKAGHTIQSGYVEGKTILAHPSLIGSFLIDFPASDEPAAYELHARLLGSSIENSWKLITFPAAAFPGQTGVIDADGQFGFLKGAAGIGRTINLDQLQPGSERVLISNRLTTPLAHWLETGGRLVLTVPQHGVLPTEPSCFWRDATEVFHDSRALGAFPHEGFVDIQFLPLSSDWRLGADSLLGKADFLVTRANPRSALYGVEVAQMKIGKGVIVATTLSFKGDSNFTAAYLLSQMADYAVSPACQPTKGMSASELMHLVKLSEPPPAP